MQKPIRKRGVSRISEPATFDLPRGQQNRSGGLPERVILCKAMEPRHKCLEHVVGHSLRKGFFADVPVQQQLSAVLGDLTIDQDLRRLRDGIDWLPEVDSA